MENVELDILVQNKLIARTKGETVFTLQFY